MLTEMRPPRLLTPEQGEQLRAAACRYYGRLPTADEEAQLREWAETALTGESVVHLVLEGVLDAGCDEDGVVVRIADGGDEG